MKKSSILFVALVFCLALFSWYLLITSSTTKMPINIMAPMNLPQNAFAYTPKNLPLTAPMLTQVQQIEFQKIFLQHHYYPWSNKINTKEFSITADGKNSQPVLQMENATIQNFSTQPGYGINYQPNSSQWIKSIVANMQLQQFPNISCQHGDQCHGIVTTNTYLRVLPTNNPSYANISIPGEGYPFDYLQASELWLGTPVLVLQQSQDHQWLLVQGPGLLGWVQARTIAFVSAGFIKTWESYPLITPTVLKFTINPNLASASPPTIYLGSLLPYINQNAGEFTILLPTADHNHNATVKNYQLSNANVMPWPLTTTPKNFNLLINQILGMTYGWGGIGFNTDCSGTIRRLFTAFGIWLPRNAKDQIDFSGTMHLFPLSHYSITKRRSILLNPAAVHLPSLMPYFTLIGFGDENNGITHIVLYLGKYPQQHPNDILVFQSTWGKPLMQGNDKVGRIIIGRTVITPMSFGAHLDLVNHNYHDTTLWDIPGIYVTNLLSNSP